MEFKQAWDITKCSAYYEGMHESWCVMLCICVLQGAVCVVSNKEVQSGMTLEAWQ
jgi:hypothetical protein